MAGRKKKSSSKVEEIKAEEMDSDSTDDSEVDPSDDEDLEEDNVERNDQEEDDSSDETSDEESDSISGDEFNQQQDEESTPNLPAQAPGDEQCTFDLRHLVALNSHQVDAKCLYKSRKGSSSEGKVTIAPENLGVSIIEDHLLERAQDGCTQLISALWQLPTEKSDAGPLVKLPSYFEIKIPRSLPAPPPKQETKWEKFAKERGIALSKEKRSQKVWDETTGTWMYRHGYKKANNDATEWPIMEVKGNEDPFEDPWERIRDAKRTRVEKNVENRMRNQERAGNLTKGTATRVIKSREKTRKAGKMGGNMDRDGVLPSGVPVDLKASKVSGPIDSKKRGKDSTVAALKAVQLSTASIGKFDQMRAGEPERKKASAGLKKRKYDSATDKKTASTESARNTKLLNAVMTGGGAAREKAKRNGSLAKGETAYDYEYDDGLGASTFRKKKGRGGAGKIKKMTKKRVK